MHFCSSLTLELSTSYYVFYTFNSIKPYLQAILKIFFQFFLEAVFAIFSKTVVGSPDLTFAAEITEYIFHLDYAAKIRSEPSITVFEKIAKTLEKKSDICFDVESAYLVKYLAPRIFTFTLISYLHILTESYSHQAFLVKVHTCRDLQNFVPAQFSTLWRHFQCRMPL